MTAPSLRSMILQIIVACDGAANDYLLREWLRHCGHEVALGAIVAELSALRRFGLVELSYPMRRLVVAELTFDAGQRA